MSGLYTYICSKCCTPVLSKRGECQTCKIKELNKKITKLKALILLVDESVSNVTVCDTQLRQWSEFISCFPEEGGSE